MKKLLIKAILLLLLTACAQANSKFEKEANALCDIYSTENLKETKGMDVLEKFEFVNAKIRSTIKSPELHAIFKKLAEEGNKDFYTALNKEMSNLTGKEWNCRNAEIFYAISWERAGDKQNEIIVPVYLVEGKAYHIDGQNYDFEDVDKIKEALHSAAHGKEYKIRLQIPVSTSRETLNKYLEPFRKIGVKKLSVIEK